MKRKLEGVLIVLVCATCLYLLDWHLFDLFNLVNLLCHRLGIAVSSGVSNFFLLHINLSFYLISAIAGFFFGYFLPNRPFLAVFTVLLSQTLSLSKFLSKGLDWQAFLKLGLPYRSLLDVALFLSAFFLLSALLKRTKNLSPPANLSLLL